MLQEMVLRRESRPHIHHLQNSHAILDDTEVIACKFLRKTSQGALELLVSCPIFPIDRDVLMAQVTGPVYQLFILPFVPATMALLLSIVPEPY